MKITLTPQFDSDNSAPADITFIILGQGLVSIETELPPRRFHCEESEFRTVLRALLAALGEDPR